MGYRAHVDVRMTDLPSERPTGDADRPAGGPAAGPAAGSVALVVVLSVVVVLFACGGTGLGLYLINGHHGGAAVAASAPSPSASGRATGSPKPTSSPLNPAAVV